MGDDGAVVGIDPYGWLNFISIRVSRHSIPYECNDEYPSCMMNIRVA